MALGETADLIIALNLRGNAERGLRGINSALDNLSRNATVRGGLGQISQGIGVGLRNSAIIGGVALAGLVTQVKAGVESLRELENAEAQTAAALESTGGVSGQTVASIRALSEEYETLGGVLDDKVIQAGANVLLTFRRIDKEAFEPALEAALNINTALGGGEEGLQTAIIQVGKALEDPISGVTALRKAGIQLTDQQRDQIKELVEANDLYGAQSIILDEIEAQVGGRFAAAGTTNAASVARMGDAWEDLQQTLTRATLPAIDKVSRRLTTIFSDPAVIARVSEFGDRLAGFLNEENLDKAEDAIRGTFGYLASIPWGAIGDGLRIAGQAAGVAVAAFKSLPPGVQNALITLLAANKLTGGLVSAGLGQLAAVALGQLRTITAAHVTVVGGTVTGGPGGLPIGPTKGPGGGLGGTVLKLTGVGIAAALAAEFSDEIIGFGTGLRADLAKSLDLDLPTFSAADMDWPFGTRNTPRLPGPDWFADILGGTPSRVPMDRTPKPSGSRSAGVLDLAAQDRTYQAEDRRLNAAQLAELARNRTETSTRLLALSGNYAGTNARLDRSNASLATIAAKNFSPTINLTNSIRLSPTVIHQRIVQQNVISGFTSNDNSAGI